MMDYFILGQKKERGCPEGMLDCVLYDQFYSRKEASKVVYGAFPWYDRGKDISGANVLIANSRLYDFDMRHITVAGVYAVSEEFLGLLKEFSAPIKQCRPISVCSRDGKPISTKAYYAVTFEGTPFSEIADMAQSEIWPNSHPRFSRCIIKLKVRDGFKRDLFKFSNVDVFHDGIYCSERFKAAAEAMKVKGVGFNPISTFNWRKADRFIEGQLWLV